MAKLAARGTSREMFADGPTARRATAEIDDAPAAAARAIVMAFTHDFGEMSAYEVNRHTFVVRNEGEAPLTIEEGPANCKCTTSRLPINPIPPGGEGEIEIEWTVRPSVEPFDQTAEFVTNDPINRLLQLRIVGRVLGEIYVDPPYFDAERSEPGRQRELKVTISSPLWDQFEVLSAKPSLAGIECSATPVADADVVGQDAKSAWRVQAVLPADLSHGRFRETVSVQIQPSGGLEQPRRIEIPIVGSVLRRVAVYGKGIDGDGIVRFGVLAPLQEHRLKFGVKVRDEDPELRIAEVEVEPDFLQVKLTPFPSERNVNDSYFLDVVVPDDAPASVFQGDSRGKIKIVFDHPRIEPLELGVDFAVRSHRRSSIASATIR